MALIDASGRLFGKINVFDFGLTAIALLVAIGIIGVQSGWQRTSGQVVKGEADIEYTVYLRDIKTLRTDLFKPGEKLAITIRNQPRGEVEIVKSETIKKKALVGTNAGIQIVDSPDEANVYHFLVTVKDHAETTDDGFVTNGVKVKIGTTIDVEGHDYWIKGVIADVRAIRPVH